MKIFIVKGSQITKPFSCSDSCLKFIVHGYIQGATVEWMDVMVTELLTKGKLLKNSGPFQNFSKSAPFCLISKREHVLFLQGILQESSLQIYHIRKYRDFYTFVKDRILQ